MHRPPDKSLWTGRTDPGETRLHQVVQFEGNAKVAFIGFASDEGVRRNQGRPGAAEGPTALRKQLANLAWDSEISVLDLGDVVCEGTDLESAQAEYAQLAAKQAHNNDVFLVSLGGGHELAWADYTALRQTHPTAKIGLLNFDAHFDLRESDQPTSGTPFLQALRNNPKTSYFAVGISPAANTQGLFKTADDLAAGYFLDLECRAENLPDIESQIEDWIETLDFLMVSFDLDVLPAAVAPGVSAPAARGVSLEILEPLLETALSCPKTKIFEVAELNPAFDRDNQTARTAARLIHDAITTMHRGRQ